MNGNGSGRRPQPPDGLTQLIDGPQTVEEMLLAGEVAARALREPGMNQAYQSGLRSIINEWLGSQPHEEAKRKSLYNEAKGMERAFRSLVSDAQTAEEHLRMEAEKQRANAAAVAAGEPPEYA